MSLDPVTSDALASELLAVTARRTALIVTHRPDQTPDLPTLRLGDVEALPPTVRPIETITRHHPNCSGTRHAAHRSCRENPRTSAPTAARRRWGGAHGDAPGDLRPYSGRRRPSTMEEIRHEPERPTPWMW